jgi:phosphinothricin acetyltransferase
MKLHRRDAVESDLPAILEIYNEALPTGLITAGTSAVSVDERVLWFQQHNHSRPLWVMEADDQVVGWLGFEPFNQRAAYHITAETIIYITKDYRRKGIGTQLLQAAIEYAPAVGIRRLVGLIMATNTPALEFFSRASYQRWARLPHVLEISGIERDLIVVGRKS